MTKNQRILLIGAGLLVVLALAIIKIPTITRDSQNQPASSQVNEQKQPRVLAFPSDVSTWKTYTSEEYGFSIQYPPEFVVESHEGSSASEKKFLSLDIGTRDYLAKLKASNEGPGSDGLPLFVRMTVATPSTPLTAQDAKEFSDCKERASITEQIIVNGEEFTKCEYLLMDNFPSLSVAFTSDETTKYVFESHRYGDSDKVVIEQILSTLKIK